MPSEQLTIFDEEDFIVVWIDESDIDTKHSVNTRFGHAAHDIQTFDDIEKAVDYIERAKNESIFLIISELLIQQHVFQLHELPQLHSIYIITSNGFSSNDEYPQVFQKIRGIYSDILSLFEHLTQDIRVAEAMITPISIFNSNLTSLEKLNASDCSFIYSHLLKEIMLDFDDDGRLKRQFVTFCREKYKKNKEVLRIIDEFNDHYQNHSPIWWYTRECFLYKMLNKAVRVKDIDILLKMRFLICDLHHQIIQIHSSLSTNTYHIVYRGQGLCKKKFAKLETNINGILSFNNFFLANGNHDISLHFAQHSLDKVNVVPVIFEIHIPSSSNSTPFASLDGIGYFLTETEILFPMHSIFRIQNIECMENQIWNIRLEMINDRDSDLCSLIDFMKNEIQGFNSMHRFGNFLIHTNEYDKAKYIFESIYSKLQTQNPEELAYIEDCLGKIYYEKEDWKNSLEHYGKSLDMKLTFLPDNHPQLALAHTNLASLFRRMNMFEEAIKHYRHALDIELKCTMADQQNMATCYMNIGDILVQLGHFEEAQHNLQDALKIQHNILSFNHPDLVKTQKHLFDVCHSMGHYRKALENAKALLCIAQKSYPTNHFQIAIAHYNIAVCLDKLERYQEAIEEAEKAVKIGQHSYPLGHAEMSELESLLELVQWKNAEMLNIHE